MSLKRSLVLAISALLTVFGIAAALYSYHSARQEAWNLMDLQQQQIARFVGDGRAILQGHAALPPHDADEDYIIRIDHDDGRPAIQSNPKLTFPAGLADGFTEFDDGNGPWRVFTLRTAGQTVHVAQKTTERNEIATDSAFNTALPFFFALPWIWGLVYWIVGIIITRIGTITLMVQARRSGDASPLPVSAAPVELQPLVSATNDAFERLDEALARQKLFLANAAHELRTPLAALQIQAGNLRRATTPDAWATRAQDVEAGIARLSALTGQLLLLARQDAVADNTPNSDTDLAEATIETVAALHPLAHDRGIDLGVDAAPGIFVRADRRDLQVMLEALIHNAIHYSGQGGVVDVGVTASKEQAFVTISDNGPGIPDTMLDQVFDRFVRIEGTGKSGSGLGLPIARSIAERIGGTILLENRTDRSGLIVTITLPVSSKS